MRVLHCIHRLVGLLIVTFQVYLAIDFIHAGKATKVLVLLGTGSAKIMLLHTTIAFYAIQNCRTFRCSSSCSVIVIYFIFIFCIIAVVHHSVSCWQLFNTFLSIRVHALVVGLKALHIKPSSLLYLFQWCVTTAAHHPTYRFIIQLNFLRLRKLQIETVAHHYIVVVAALFLLCFNFRDSIIIVHTLRYCWNIVVRVWILVLLLLRWLCLLTFT